MKEFEEVRRLDFRADAALLKVLGHPERLRILEGMKRGGSTSVKDIWMGLNISQAAVSQHLAVLKEAGIVRGTRKGNRVFYDLASHKTEDILRVLVGDQPLLEEEWDDWEEDEEEDSEDGEGHEESPEGE